jgi:hypothetical protein
MRQLISFSMFDVDEEDGQVVDGNIMPFDTSTSEALETWEDHSDVTVTLSVVSDTHFTCFTGTNVQILTPGDLCVRKVCPERRRTSTR